jgi:trehalose 6-phosphate phosphatase
MRIIPGKLVVNLVPAGAPNKGDVLLASRARAGADSALYVGDDVSDEDVFSLDRPGRLLSVRVGRSPRSAAAYYLRNQAEIEQLLSTLIELRRVVPKRVKC